MANESGLGVDDWSSLQRKGAELGQTTLYTITNDRPISLADGYIPLLVNLTFEDKAAKGLRKHKGGDKREAAVYVSALEAVRDNRVLLLTGGSGSGKTTFAKYLIFGHAADVFRAKSDPVPRNEEGDRHEEIWGDQRIRPFLVSVSDVRAFRELEASLPALFESWRDTEKADGGEDLLLILEIAMNSGEDGAGILASIVNSIRSTQDARLLILSREEAIEDWDLPSGLSKLRLLPLLPVQRRDAAQKASLDWDVGFGKAASLPAIFALSLEAGDVGHTRESALDAWLLRRVPSLDDRRNLLQASLDKWSSANKKQPDTLEETAQKWPLILCAAVTELLIAAHLQATSPQRTVKLFDEGPRSAAPIVRSLLRRSVDANQKHILIHEFLSRHEHDPDSERAQRVALLLCEFISGDDTQLLTKVQSRLLRTVALGTLPVPDRVEAGQYLSLWGDPRDLTALVEVPDGTSVFGSSSHPNSSPAHELHLERFKIGAYPVVNRDYKNFVLETGRVWLSADAHDPRAGNTPATDLTWHDARDYCKWLTLRWRASGKIGHNENVQLPSEPQWERASRGDQRESHAGQIIYPWGTNWVKDASNSEELALNNKCAVGLIPQGRSPFGCYDMTGHVWEWCTTLWGDDMATPTFRYPWNSADGREDLLADDSIRRVLRGGCFSSGETKATCSYRGSLEATGFWRGNGFRIVVVPEEKED